MVIYTVILGINIFWVSRLIELFKHIFIILPKKFYHGKNIYSAIGMEGDLQTIMAGLNCGTPSEYGWRILKKSADAFLSCDDQVTTVGMKQLYFPSGEY